MLMSKHGMVDTSEPWLLCSCAYLLLERHPRPILFSVNFHLSLPSSGYSGGKKKKNISSGPYVNPFRNEYIFLFYINALLPFTPILSPLHLKLQALVQPGKYIIIGLYPLMKSGFIFKKKKQILISNSISHPTKILRKDRKPLSF